MYDVFHMISAIDFKRPHIWIDMGFVIKLYQLIVCNLAMNCMNYYIRGILELLDLFPNE